MAYNGAGLYSLPAPEYPAVPGTTILAEDYNTVLADLASALSSVLVRDGQSAMTGNLNLGGFGLTNVTSLTGLTAITADAAGVTVNGSLTFAVGGTLTFNGTANFLGTTTVPTKAAATNTADAASCAFVQAVAMNAALPAQAGNAGKYIKTDGTTASWVVIPPPSIIRSARTANTILGVADTTTLIEITSGTFTQTFDAAATLGNGWYCYIRNSGTGDITIPSSDGRVNWIMYSGETRLFFTDGVNFYSTWLTAFSKTFTASSNFIKPPGYAVFAGLAWSGGGSGQKSGSLPNLAKPGGGGGCFPFQFNAGLLANIEVVTIGAGGAAVSVTGPGLVGGTTSLGPLFQVGMSTYYIGGSVFASGSPFTASSSNSNGTGFEASRAASGEYSSVYGGVSGREAGVGNTAAVFGGVYGAGCGGYVNDSASGNTIVPPATSLFGGDGGVGSVAGVAGDGTAPGGGGGATCTGTSGAGARGELQIWGL